MDELGDEELEARMFSPWRQGWARSRALQQGGAYFI